MKNPYHDVYDLYYFVNNAFDWRLATSPDIFHVPFVRVTYESKIKKKKYQKYQSFGPFCRRIDESLADCFRRIREENSRAIGKVTNFVARRQRRRRRRPLRFLHNKNYLGLVSEQWIYDIVEFVRRGVEFACHTFALSRHVAFADIFAIVFA